MHPERQTAEETRMRGKKLNYMVSAHWDVNWDGGGWVEVPVKLTGKLHCLSP